MYHRLVRRLIYLSLARLDIAYAVSITSQFMHNLKELHIQTTYRILHYSKWLLGKGIILRKNDKLLREVYIDVDYVVSVVHIRSTIDYYTFLKQTSYL